ncbi:DUF2341 domain-containing protein [Thermoproteota archaeon]
MNRIIVFSVLTITLLFGGAISNFIMPVNASPVWWNEDWQFRKEFTINHSKVNCDLTNFPVLIFRSNDDQLRDYAQDDGDDIAFTDSNQQQLDHEIEFFDGDTGTLYAWIRIPNLLSDSDTTVFMYYNNSAATDQQNPTTVWDTNYKMVQHLNEPTGLHLDSTINTNDGEPSGTLNQNAAGIIDGADDFNNVNSFVNFGNDSSLAITNKITFEAWIHPNSFASSGDYDNIFSKGGGSRIPYQFYLDSQTFATGNISFKSTGSSYGVVNVTSDQFSWGTSGRWHQIVVTVDSSTSTVKFYLNGTLVGTKSGVLGKDNGGYAELAAFNAQRFFEGPIDEVRVSDKVRDLCWINTSFENQKKPADFIRYVQTESVSSYKWLIRIDSSPINGSDIIQVDSSPIITPYAEYWLEGDTHSLNALSPRTISGDRYTWSNWSDTGSQTHIYTVPGHSENVTAYYSRQFYLTLDSKFDEPLGEDWYDEGDDASFSVTSPRDFSNGTRAICEDYTVNGTTIPGSSGTITMNSSYTVTFNWATYFLNRTITIDSNNYFDGKEVKVDGIEYNTPRNFSWVNATTHQLEALSPLVIDSGNRLVWNNWSNGKDQIHTYTVPNMDENVTANYDIQYFLTINSDYDDPQGQGWYNENENATFSVTSPADHNGTRHFSTGFTGDKSGNTTVGWIIMNSPKTITFTWDDAVQYYLTVNSAYGTTHGEGWYNPGDTPEFYVTPEFIEVNGTRHVFQGWTGDYIDGANPAGANQILMDGPKTVTAVWRDRFFIEIISPYGSPKGSSWPFKGENFEVSVTSPDSGYVVTGFKLDGGSLQPGAKYMFVNVQEPHTIQFFWEILTETTVFTLDCDTNPPSKGTIVVGTTVYNDGESLTTLPGIYNIQANPDDDYSFTRWQTSGGVSVANSGSSTTTVTLAGDGTLTMIQNILGVAPPPGVWGGPETQFQCIIATAAYGGTMAPEVVYMRNVRDNMIGSTPIGNILVSGFNTFYYSWSPPVAQWIAGSEGLRTTFRVLLLPISASVHSAELTYTTVSPFNPTMASVTAFLLAASIAIGAYIIAPIFAGLTIYRKKYVSHT